MAFVQIQAPSVETKKPLAIGIDLGTTHSLVALEQNGQIKFLEVNNSPLIPSIVHYDSEQNVRVGSEAESYLNHDPKNTMYSIKRLMGRSIEDLKQLGIEFPYEYADQDGVLPQIQAHNQTITPIHVSAQILKYLLGLAQQNDQNISQAVITVPAYFDEAQRQATKEAAQMAGISVLRLISEPTAAAIAYGLQEKSKGLCLVYDLGGGTFDVSLLKIEKGLFEVLATGGHPHMGGDDIDQLLFPSILQQAPTLKEDTASLRLIAKTIKQKLSSSTTVHHTYQNQEITLTRSELEQSIEEFIQKTVNILNGVLQTAQVRPEDIDTVLLVGGTTRIPYIYKKLDHLFPEKVLNQIDPDLVVAQGAAIQASILSGHRKDPHVLLDVIPLSLGLETMGGLVEKVLLRNSKIPCKQTERFSTYQDGQTGMTFHVVQGEREQVKHCRSLARFELTGIPSMPAGQAKVDVTFQIDADGLLSVTAEEIAHNHKASIEIKPTFGLSLKEVNDALMDSISHASEDIIARKIANKTLEAQQLILSVKKALESVIDFPSTQADDIKAVIQNLNLHIELGENLSLINKSMKQLENLAEPLMNRCLQQALNQAISGKTIDAIEKEYD